MSDAAKKTYQLKTDYYALGPNCTTLSIDGAKTAFPEFDKGGEKYIRLDEVLSFGERLALQTIGGPSRLFLPANLKDFLLNGSTHKSVRINSYGSRK